MPTRKEPEVESQCNPDERDFWTRIGIPYCDKCCGHKVTDAYTNQVLCRIGDSDTCPLIESEPK